VILAVREDDRECFGGFCGAIDSTCGYLPNDKFEYFTAAFYEKCVPRRLTLVIVARPPYFPPPGVTDYWMVTFYAVIDRTYCWKKLLFGKSFKAREKNLVL